MDKYPRYFMISSMVYLVVGTLLGKMMAVHLIDPSYRFVHIHLNLYGFMAMMIFGVAYHILPRFMGKTLKWPLLLPIHFYSANLGLIFMMAAYMADGYLDPDSLAGQLFHASSGFAFLGVMIFAVNLIPVLMLTERKPLPAGPAGTTNSPVAASEGEDNSEDNRADAEASITGDMKIGEGEDQKITEYCAPNEKNH